MSAESRLRILHWHRLVAVGQMGPGEDAEQYAANQTAQLLQAIQTNERIRELAINPLMLTVIALVHRDRVKLPYRRAELYAEAVDVLLGKWDEARGISDLAIMDDRPFVAGDKRLVLQSIALYMHENQKKEISGEEFERLLHQAFAGLLTDEGRLRSVIERFQRVIEERTGLLAARGEGVFSFSHLTFQEYLAALAVAARDDYVEYSLGHADKACWREAILLEAGHLSMQSKERTTRLIREIAHSKREPEPFYNLVLASECLRDVGESRVDRSLQAEIQNRLNESLHTPMPLTARWAGRIGLRGWVERRASIVQALARAGTGYWQLPYGEPEWVTIPQGVFWMGEGKAIHQVDLPEFQIARVPITNAQYAVFVKSTQHESPGDWDEDRAPKGRESHPVVNVSWYDASAYCAWLSKVTGRHITLPSEAQWEKAARGESDQRRYPWGNEFKSDFCNTTELGVKDTTPVGIFQEGASPYGVLDMSGNVWEWTRCTYKAYPYIPNDGREVATAKRDDVMVRRGGSFRDLSDLARCAFRNWFDPDLRYFNIGFRVVVSRAERSGAARGAAGARGILPS